MSNVLFYTTFATFSVALYAIALWLKIIFSGTNYSKPKFCLAFSYTVTLGFLQYQFADTGKIPFIGSMDNTVMGWLSMLMIVLHTTTLPTPKTKKSMFKNW